MKKILFLLALICANNMFATGILKKGTVIPVRLKSEASSREKEAPEVVVAEDVLTANGVLAVKAGTKVECYYRSDRARACGHPGTLSLRFETTQSVNGMKVTLDANTINKEGKDKHGVSIGLGAGLGCVVWPAALFLLIKGKNINIPAGAVYNDAYVAEDVIIEE